MKLAIILALAAMAFAQIDEVQVLQDTREAPLGAVYSFLVELGNGIRLQETGSEGSLGQSVAQGSYAFETPDGQIHEFTYTADENGFQAQSGSIPETPQHALEQIRFAEEQRAQGIEHDQRGFVI